MRPLMLRLPSVCSAKHPRPSLHIRVRAFAAFGDEAVDARRDNGQRYRAKLEHGIVERADVEFETRSFPNLLVATLATLPSMLLIPSAPFAPSFSPLSRRIVFSQCDASSLCWSWASFSCARATSDLCALPSLRSCRCRRRFSSAASSWAL